MSDSTSPAQNSPAKRPEGSPKPRNPVERLIVWGLILGLVALVGWEATKRFGYTNTLNRIQAAMEAEEGGGDWKPVTLEDVDQLVSGFPTRAPGPSGVMQETVIYRWQGLLKDHGGIHVTYDPDENLVLGYETDAAPEEPRLVDPSELEAFDDGEMQEPAEMPASRRPQRPGFEDDKADSPPDEADKLPVVPDGDSTAD